MFYILSGYSIQRPAYWRGGGNDALANEPTSRKYQILSNDGNAAILPICSLSAGLLQYLSHFQISTGGFPIE